MWRIVVIWLLLLLAWRTHDYVQRWSSNLVLWEYATRRAPFKPRPAVNYGVALVAAGRLQDARAAFQSAYVLAQQPQIPGWDRDEVQRAVVGNLAALDRLEAVLK